eukprot:TRINITY_DN13551_c0_g1_i1.p1 TRINITY_DN13551_c0_g1~~TRINITY_DN13551_c0_g1_i1.p1  ORF type:complete len:277 (+),score=38.28 TRINITY_DN13551_c0_g1_i1:111-941(+)
MDVINNNKELLDLFFDDSIFLIKFIKTIILLLFALGTMEIIKYITKIGIVSNEISRKLVHICIGSGHLIGWVIFSPNCDDCRYYSALIPSLVLIKLLLIGLGIIKDEATIKMICRAKNKNEKENLALIRSQILEGPLFYGIVIIYLTLYQYASVTSKGLVTCLILCTGDGFAGLIGKEIGKTKLPHNKNKSLEGTVAYISISFLTTSLYIFIFKSLGWFQFDVVDNDGALFVRSLSFFRIFIICIFSSLVESFNLGKWDNIIVPFFTFCFASFLIP